MTIYFETLQQFQASGGMKATTITAKQLLPAVVAHMQRMDRKFTLQVNGRLPKSMDALLEEVFDLCHLQHPFYTQHCASRSTRYMSTSKNRVKIEFTLSYRMSREEEKWVVGEIRHILKQITHTAMNDVEKVVAVHDYIIRAYDYEMQTQGSPFTVYTFMHEKQGVCMAYALLFEKMMEELGIPCYYVVGKADGESDLGHAWNMVKLDGEWYHVDATWNDLGTRTATHEIRYRYFLRSDEFFKRDHQWDLDHYPPCTSDRFEKLAALYDAALYDGTLYFPHPKTAQLATIDLSKLVFKKELEVRAQFCTMHDKQLYFSNYSDHGYLYMYDVEARVLHKLSDEKVTRIKSNEARIVVTYENDEQFILTKSESNEEHLGVAKNLPDTVVPLLSFGDSWFGSYEGKEACVAFESKDGMRLLLQDSMKQLTVDLLLHKGLEVNMTTMRREVQLTKPAILIIPKLLIPSDVQLRLPSGQLLDYVERHDAIEVMLERSTKLTFS
ncbi:transglutaminase domain-containing protein [Solibacillus sp. FSL H8-0538]|uniref:transglutaminase domain-containing protein n=1 Tax=Solibacillus sp. FSL H8-0538 TaxID=2921400 RepID=UPI0030FB6752